MAAKRVSPPQPVRRPQTTLSVFVRWVEGQGTTIEYRWNDERAGVAITGVEPFHSMSRDVETLSAGAALNAVRGTVQAAYEAGRHARVKDRT